eukprot:380940-Prymnesium_polylepis.1
MLREATKPLHSALHSGCALVRGGDVSGGVRRMCVVQLADYVSRPGSLIVIRCLVDAAIIAL